MRISAVALLLVLSIASMGYSQNSKLFSEATEFYNKGEYSKAIENYEQIIANGQHSAELYFNLGNCHYKLNAIGPSIYYYEKALLLKPGDGEILSNLKYAQNMRLDAVEEMPRSVLTKLYDSLVNALSHDQWAYLAIILMMLFVLFYLAYYFLRPAGKKRMAFITSILALFLGLTATVMAYLQYQAVKNDNPAIVFSKEVRITSEPNTNSEAVFILHEGTKVSILDGLDDWRKIRIADGQTGWLKIENIKPLKDF
ncbi:tetratricopeptide repeat protein [Flagellimonas allohymeniacidonis]|uniref:Ion channel protein n=1 Tax=Flagellimonas allohymeniacidonis TaxID=2517819 RepID=A0A4Q8QDT4_9FLAO|nr:tetratricopeptide repeat protein [Allomuricauda hymeniacidonis]TAI47727.1 ion channel protein [Allomuricauda hymeniacidonis]